MNKKILLLLVIAQVLVAMEAPIPPNRYFLRDLMEAYATGKPLQLESKSKATLTDIKNWISYARNNPKVRTEFARELQGTEEDVENALDILQYEIEQAQAKPTPSAEAQPVSKPAAQPLLIPHTKPAKPAAKLLLIPRTKPAKPAAIKPTAKSSGAVHLLDLLAKKGAIQKRYENVMQVKTVDQFKLGQNVGPATCPVQALRNTIKLLQFVRTGLATYLDLLADTKDAREFLNFVEKCQVGTQWLTAEELKRIIFKTGQDLGDISQSITALDTPQELELYPQQLKALQDKFKQKDASHGFIIGTMDIGQHTGERGHYFSLVIDKKGPDYLYLIADTAPANDHLDPNSYNYKRVRYLADLITKGRSDIDLDKELNQRVGNRYQDILVRAMQRGALFDYKSLSKDELQGLQKALDDAQKNKNEWKNRTRMNDVQLQNAIVVVKEHIRNRLSK